MQPAARLVCGRERRVGWLPGWHMDAPGMGGSAIAGSHGGKILVIFDSNVENIINSEAWTKQGPPDSENSLEPKQRSLLTYLRKARQVNITQVWVGGEGNTERGICLQLAYDWCVRVIEADWSSWKGIGGAERICEEGLRRQWAWQAP
jgi:hypothetical protein